MSTAGIVFAPPYLLIIADITLIGQLVYAKTIVSNGYCNGLYNKGLFTVID